MKTEKQIEDMKELIGIKIISLTTEINRIKIQQLIKNMIST